MPILSKLVVLSTIIALAVAQTDVTVSTGTKFQTIDGFGISQAFGRAKEFQNAASATQKQALDYLFSTSTGAGFSIIRNRIGSGGSGDSILPTCPSSPSGSPAYSWDGDDRGQVWFSKQAISYGVTTIYADAWSAPGCMKTSGSESTPGYLCGTPNHSCSSGDWRQAYANFLVKYTQYYASAGITITHLGFLNEPDFQPSYSQMQISSNAAEAIDFIPILYKTFNAAGLSTKLTCCDAVGWAVTNTYTTNLVNAGSTQYLSLITSHSYSAHATTPLSQTTLRKWNTEAGVSSAFVTTWYSSGADNEGMTWAGHLARAMIDAQLSAYLYWEGFEIQETQSGSHLLDAIDGTNVTPSGIFWAFAMWSRHIRPGAVRINNWGTLTNVIWGAFQNTDGSVVTVFTNTGSSTVTPRVTFSGFTASSCSAWVTSNSVKFGSTSATLSGGQVTVSVAGHTVVTVKCL